MNKHNFIIATIIISSIKRASYKMCFGPPFYTPIKLNKNADVVFWQYIKAKPILNDCHNIKTSECLGFFLNTKYWEIQYDFTKIFNLGLSVL